jgi:hypothetical protein
VVLLDDDLDALPHFGQHGVKIASHFGFAHVDSGHDFDYGSVCSAHRPSHSLIAES